MEFPKYTKTYHYDLYPALSPSNPKYSATGKVVAITGGGNGIGKSIAAAFVEAGAKDVIILGRRENLLLDTKKELELAGRSKIHTYVADVVDAKSVNAAFESIKETVGLVDILVSNAGYMASPEPIATAPVDDWWRSYEVNVKGTVIAFQAFVKAAAPDPVFISLNTAAAHAGHSSNWSAYGSSKTATLEVLAYIQQENPTIRAVSMHPGYIATTDMGSAVDPGLKPNDVKLAAAFAVWLASPEANWTGGKLLWANWDIEELVAWREKIVNGNELSMTLKGWPTA